MVIQFEDLSPEKEVQFEDFSAETEEILQPRFGC
jgi:hypothetical protein